MQTFLPYPDSFLSALCLDQKRLGKQRVEALQILDTLIHGGAWGNHPAVNMWAGYERALVSYGWAVCTVWKEKGFKDTCLDKMRQLVYNEGCEFRGLPPWWGGPIHSSHRAALLCKDYNHYKQFNWKEKPVIEYHWP